VRPPILERPTPSNVSRACDNDDRTQQIAPTTTVVSLNYAAGSTIPNGGIAKNAHGTFSRHRRKCAR
jgi:hypothetical protein